MADDEESASDITVDGGVSPKYSFWQSVWDAGLKQRGIMSKRVHDSILDRQMFEQNAAQTADAEISTQLKAAMQTPGITDTDQRQLALLASRQAMVRQYFGHPDPRVRAKAADEMLNINQAASNWMEDFETRTEKLDDQRHQERLDVGNEHRKAINETAKSYRDIDTREKVVYDMIKAAGDNTDADPVQSKFRETIGYNAAQTDRGPGAGINLFGMLSAHMGDDLKPQSKDTMVKLTAAWAGAQKTALKQQLADQVALAEHDGFKANIENGEVQLEDLNAPTLQPLAQRPPLGEEEQMAAAAQSEGVRQSNQPLTRYPANRGATQAEARPVPQWLQRANDTLQNLKARSRAYQDKTFGALPVAPQATPPDTRAARKKRAARMPEP